MADNPKAQWQPIDLNRGVTMRRDQESGAQVYMYKDNPGYYFSQFGKPLPIAMAEKVGFPVAQLRKERERNERRAFASKEIDKELEMADKTRPQVLQTRGEFRLIDRGIGRADVQDVDGNVYNPQPLPLVAAERLLTAMAGEAVPLNPQEVLVARKKHDAVERVREGYDKELDVEGVSQVVGGKIEPAVWREGVEVDPATQDSYDKSLPGHPGGKGPGPVTLPGRDQAEVSEKARLKAEDPDAPNAQPVGEVSPKVFPTKFKTYDDPNYYQGGEPSNPDAMKEKAAKAKADKAEDRVANAKVRSLG